eukprot:5428421-Amphidinium_carterae.1
MPVAGDNDDTAAGTALNAFPLSLEQTAAYAELQRCVKQLPEACDPCTLFRFLAASKFNPPKAVRKIKLYQEKLLEWQRLGMDDVEEDEVNILLDGRGAVNGYWQVGGVDSLGCRTAWLFQGNACAPADLKAALTGVKAAHCFFNGLASEWDAATEGITVVVMMSDVTYSRMLADVKNNKHVSAIGDYFTDVLPVRCRRVIFVDCPGGLKMGLQAWATVAFSSKQRHKMMYVPSLQALKKEVPPHSWPLSLQKGSVSLHSTRVYSQHFHGKVEERPEKPCRNCHHCICFISQKHFRTGMFALLQRIRCCAENESHSWAVLINALSAALIWLSWVPYVVSAFVGSVPSVRHILAVEENFQSKRLYVCMPVVSTCSSTLGFLCVGGTHTHAHDLRRANGVVGEAGLGQAGAQPLQIASCPRILTMPWRSMLGVVYN